MGVVLVKFPHAFLLLKSNFASSSLDIHSLLSLVELGLEGELSSILLLLKFALLGEESSFVWKGHGELVLEFLLLKGEFKSSLLLLSSLLSGNELSLQDELLSPLVELSLSLSSLKFEMDLVLSGLHSDLLDLKSPFVLLHLHLMPVLDGHPVGLGPRNLEGLLGLASTHSGGGSG